MAEVVSSPLSDVLEVHRDEIKAIAAQHHAHSVAVFGSVARHEDTAASDLDLLVDLDHDARPFAILALGAALETALGVKVDIGTRESLRPELRDTVLAEAILL